MARKPVSRIGLAACLALTTATAFGALAAPAGAALPSDCNAFSTPASSSCVGIGDDGLWVLGSPAKDAITVQLAGDPHKTHRLRVTDARHTLRASAGCSQAGTAVECPGPVGSYSNVTVLGGAGGDELAMVAICDAGNSVRLPYLPQFSCDVFGQDGGDRISGSQGNDHLYGGAGADPLISGGDGSDTIDGGFGGFAPDSSAKDEGDKIRGGAGDDKVNGSGGADTISGGDGRDTLVGGPSTAWGLDGDDQIDGGAGNDILYGHDGVDTLRGGTEDDKVQGDGGSDLLYGDLGSDTVTYSGSPVTVDLSNNNAKQGTATDSLSGFENAIGTVGNDVLIGDGNSNKLDGAAGNDGLFGLGGPDGLIGGFGNDSIFAKDGGADIIDCGVGLDTGGSADAVDGKIACEF